MDTYKFIGVAILALLLLLAGSSALAQTHTLTSWKGSAYHIDNKYLQAGFGPHVFDGKFYGHIELEALDIKLQPEDKVFPGVYERVQFGVLVRSKLEVLELGCYKFSLNSDDGSVLWIDDELAVSNDGHHAEKRVTDSLILDAKIYEAKVWYYNAFNGGYALELDINRIGNDEACPRQKLSTPPAEPIIVTGNFLFAQGEHIIPRQGAEKFDELADQLSTMKLKKLTVVGHTDNMGETEDNQLLSEHRALSVLTFLQSRVNLNGVEVLSIGKGETEPIATNETKLGQRNNRRVEIRVE